MNRSIAYLVILVVFASTMGVFIRYTADKALEEHANVFNMQARQQLEPEDAKSRINIGESTFAVASPTLSLAGTTLNVEVADDAIERAQGLSGRASLQPNTGMLFLFGEPVLASFWMKDMNFALDILWIRDGVVVDITQNIPAPTGDELPTYQPNEPVDMVLEVNAGWVAEHGGKNALIGEYILLQN
ncbi:MAG: DUF192 domain-containing protein [Candidatus Spechtbacterales bacterium]